MTARGSVLSGYIEEGERCDLSRVTNTAIGHFSSGTLPLADGVLLAGIGLAEERGGLVHVSGFNRGRRGFVGLAEEREFHGLRLLIKMDG